MLGLLSEGEASPPCFGVASPPAVSLAHSATQQSLLDAMRNLSLQMEGTTKEQAAMKQRMDEISAGNAPKPLHETNQMPSRSSDNVLPVTGAIKTHHLPEKFVAAAVRGEYVDFSDVLTSLSVLRSAHSDEGMLRSLSGT